MTAEWEDGGPEGPSGVRETFAEDEHPEHLREMAVLCAVLGDPAQLANLRDLRPIHFHSEAHRLLFEAMVSLEATGLAVDSVSVLCWLKEHGKEQRAGGVSYLTRVCVEPAALIPRHLREHAVAIRGLAENRTHIWNLKKELAEYESGRKQVPVSGDQVTSRIVWAGDLAKPLAPRNWICEGLGIAQGRPTILVGEGGSRKGWLSMGLLLMGAAGRPLFGHTLKPGFRGLYLDWEQTLWETQNRFQLLAGGHGIDLNSLGKSLGYAWLPVGSLAKRESMDPLCQQTDGIDLAVVDATHSASPGVKENSEEASAPGQLLLEVSEKTGCAFLLLDHVGLPDPSGSRQRQHAIRGHSSKRDMSSTLLVASSSKGHPTLVTTERCQGKPQDDWAKEFYFTVVKAEDGVALTLADEPDPEDIVNEYRQENRRGEVVMYLAKNHHVRSGNDLFEKLKGSRPQLLKALKDLMSDDEGRVIVKHDGCLRLRSEVEE